jgi:hypothetical protein
MRKKFLWLTQGHRPGRNGLQVAGGEGRGQLDRGRRRGHRRQGQRRLGADVIKLLVVVTPWTSSSRQDKTLGPEKLMTAVIYGFRNKLERLSSNTRLGWKGLQAPTL